MSNTQWKRVPPASTVVARASTIRKAPKPRDSQTEEERKKEDLKAQQILSALLSKSDL